MTNEMREKWEALLRQANKLRADAFAADCAGLHAMASLKMEEMQRLVDGADADARANARAEARRTRGVRLSLTLELGGRP